MGTRRVERIDHAEELSAPRETPEGFLEVEAFVSRPGIYRYINTREDEADGLGPAGSERLELRPDDEVFSPKSLATYRTRSITVGHPRKNGKRVRVDSTNVRDFEVGIVDGAARRVGDKLAAKLVIKDKRAIADAKAGKRQVSPGHFIDLEVKKGVDPKYGRYDCIQRDIDINHLALVEKARGGDTLRLRLDGGDDVRGAELREDDLGGKLTTTVEGHAHLVRFSDWDGRSCTSGSTSWSTSEGEEQAHEHAWVKNSDGTITIAASNGHTHELAEETSPLFAPMRSDGDDMPNEPDEKKAREDELETLRGEIKQLEKERDGLKLKLQERLDAAEAESVKKAQERADAAEARLDEMRGSFQARVRSFAALQVIAKSVMGDRYRTDDKDDDQIVRDVVKRLDSSIDVINTPIPELRGHFKQLVARHDRARSEYADASTVIGVPSRSHAEAQERQRKTDDDWNNRWKRQPASSQMLRKES